jgi:hypothetical protein
MMGVLELRLPPITTLGSTGLPGPAGGRAGPLAGGLAAGFQVRAPGFLHFRLDQMLPAPPP